MLCPQQYVQYVIWRHVGWHGDSHPLVEESVRRVITPWLAFVYLRQGEIGVFAADADGSGGHFNYEGDRHLYVVVAVALVGTYVDICVTHILLHLVLQCLFDFNLFEGLDHVTFLDVVVSGYRQTAVIS